MQKKTKSTQERPVPKVEAKETVHYGQRPHSGAKWILHSPRSILGRQGSEVHSKEWYGVVSLGMALLGRAWPGRDLLLEMEWRRFRILRRPSTDKALKTSAG